MIHENIELTGSFNVNGTLVIPTHAATTSALSATGSIYNDSTDNVVKLYTGTEWTVVGDQTSSPIDYLTVAGGGGSGGGGSTGYHGGGGGGGGLLSGSIPTTAGTFTVTVGAGGSAGAQSGDAGYSGTNGQDSSISGTSITTITSIGGGAGAGNATTSPGSRQGNDGGSGGGGALYSGIGGSGTVGQGNDGGNASANYQGAGGGGGSGTAGGNAVSSGGSGGEGTSSSITGTATYYGGGGAARGQSGNGAAVNGATAADTAGAANKGAGGGGRRSTSGMAGGSGVAIFAYDSGSSNCAGGIVGDAGNGRKYNQFNSSGTFKVGLPTDFQLPATDNLKLHLDAANFDSYPGTGTTWNDLSGNSNNFTLDGSGISWDEGGWFTLNDGGGSCTSGAITNVTAATFAMWIKTTDTQSLFWSYDNSQSYIGAYRVGNKEYHNEVGSPTYYQDLVEKSNIYDNIRTGNWIFVEFKSVNFSGWNANTYFNKYNTYTFSTTDIGAYYIYDKNLTEAESLQLYNATKTNFT